jgi:hypothetical protein
MSDFLKARHEHAAVKNAAQIDPGEAGDLWNAIAGLGSDPVAGSFAEAVRDTMPERFAALLGTEDIAAAYAFGIMWRTQQMRIGLCGTGHLSAWRVRDHARSSWNEFAQKADDVSELSRGFGWDDSAAWASVQNIQEARGDMSLVQRVAKLAGRMYASLKGARATKIAGVAGEVYSVEQGRDIGRLLPSTLAMMSDAIYEPVILEQLATRRAPQYAVRGTAKRSKGPLVMAIDESGSMLGARNEWAKAAAVAVARVASEEGRAVSVVHYSTSAERQALKSRDPASVVQMIRRFLDGGTMISLALNVSTDEVKALAKKGERGADIILVTDGVDYDEAGHTKAIDDATAIGARLWTVAIECDIDEKAALRSRAASYVRLGAADMNSGASVNLFQGAI